MRGLLYLSAGITCLLLLFLIGYILYRGLPNLNWTFLTSQESVLRGPTALCLPSRTPSMSSWSP
mgnify:CR=1 FL=1